MTILRATAAHVDPIIYPRLAEFSHPPHYPDPARIERILDSEQEAVFVDDMRGIVARVNENPVEMAYPVIWLGPRADWGTNNMDDLARVLLACYRDWLVRKPSQANWMTWGQFQGAADGGLDICNAWRDRLLTRASGMRAEVVEVTFSDRPSIYRVRMQLNTTVLSLEENL